MLRELTLNDFLAQTAGNEPVPGGGSLSALSGAMAAALAQMVAGLTIGRKKYAEYDEEMRGLAEHFEQLREQLLHDIDLDAEAYNRVFAAFKLPKETEEEKETRRQTIQKETIHAAEVPMQVARKVCAMLPLIEQTARHGNRNAITDACVAAMCAHTAVRGALMNVRINLTSIDDKAYVERMECEATLLAEKAADTERNILNYLKETTGL